MLRVVADLVMAVILMIGCLLIASGITALVTGG